MAKKKTVSIKMDDGVAPLCSNNAMELRLPFAVTVPGGDVRLTVDLGFTCDCPLLVFEASSVRRRGVRVSGTPQVVESGERIQLVLGSSGSEVLLERGDLVARAVPMCFSDVEFSQTR